MSERKSSNNPSLFEIFPEKFIFNLDTEDISQLSSLSTNISKEIEIKIINKSTDYIIIKIKTTKVNNYIMSLSNFVLSPKEEKAIKIRFKRNEGEKLELKSHLILFEGAAIKEEEKNLDTKYLYEKYIKKGNKDTICDIKIKTQFTEGPEDNNRLEMNDKLSDLAKASNKDIIIALILALIIGILFIN